MKTTIRWTLAGIAVAALALIAVAGDGTFFVGRDGMDEMETFDLSELAEGETRSFGEGKDQVTVTRDGGVVTLEIAGGKTHKLNCGDDDTCTISVGSSDGKRVIAISAESEHGEHGEHGDVMIHTKAHAWTSAGGEEFVLSPSANVFFHGDGEGEGDVKIMKLSLGQDVSVLECPEGDTTMRLEKDDTGVYHCPKHNVEMTKSKGGFRHGFKVIELHGDDPQEK